MAAPRTAATDQDENTESAGADAPEVKATDKAAKGGGSQLYRFHFNVGTFNDGQETELTDDEAAAYFPRYCTKISGPGEAPSGK